MDILTSSWLVLTKEWGGILSILGIFILGSGIIFLWLRFLFAENLTSSEYFVLSIGGALFPLAFGISITLLLNLLFGIRASFLSICLIIFIGSCLFVYSSMGKNLLGNWASNSSSLLPEHKQIFAAFFIKYREIALALVLILVFIGSIYIRLAFISGLITPLYFDSATHYSIIQGLIAKFETSSLSTIDTLVEGYYHLGYHAIVALIALTLNLDVKDVIFIFGQIILAILPLPMFFIVRQETKSDVAGIFALLLAGWGWSMPAYSLNWGKYPALTSILPFEFLLCAIYLILRSPKHYRWTLIIFFSFCLLVPALIHTRSLVLVSIGIVSGAAGLAWRRVPKPARTAFWVITGIGLAILIFVIQSKPVLSLAFEPYREDGRWMLLLVLLLSPFALKKFSAAAFSGILSLLLLLSSLFIPVDQFIPGYGVQTLLDRPFVEMALFFPLALLSGLGYAGLFATLKNVVFLQGTWQRWITPLVALLLFGILAINTTQYKFFPSDFSVFFTEDDAVALDWMDKNLPTDSNILISSSEAFILETKSPTSSAGTDGGIWINSLIHRNSSYANYQIDFSQRDTLDDLCKNKVTHVYIGGVAESFDTSQLQKQPAWYEMLLLLPKAQIFKVIGCY